MMASEAWNILLCRQSEDVDATDCGPTGLTRFENGTLVVQGTPPERGPPPTVKFSNYANYMVDDMPAAQKQRGPVVEAMVADVIASGQLLTPTAASNLLRALERQWPETMWNVMIEEDPYVAEASKHRPPWHLPALLTPCVRALVGRGGAGACTITFARSSSISRCATWRSVRRKGRAAAMERRRRSPSPLPSSTASATRWSRSECCWFGGGEEGACKFVYWFSDTQFHGVDLIS
jgi:hypothetical protein